MAKQDSDSSSYESEGSSDEMESSMDTNSNNSDKLEDDPGLNPTSSKPFFLPILCNKDKTAQQRIFAAYLRNTKEFPDDKRSFLINKTVENIPSNFTPWWESWKTNGKSLGESSFTSTNEPGDESIFNNWFIKSSHKTNASSWLCGSKPQSFQNKLPQVEDIEVPSIYCNVSHAKGRKAMKKERREQRNKTTGKKWFDMKLPDVDSNTKMDMEMLLMRRALDPKRFYKQNDRRGLPKYFQMGTVVDEGSDFYSSRLTKKQRKQTLVEELMADVNVRKYNKKKYGELQQKQRTKKFSKSRKT